MSSIGFLSKFFQLKRTGFNTVSEPIYKDTAFLKALSQVENAQQIGYNSEINTWLPHPSPEGGPETIGYGHKLTPSESKGSYVKVNGDKVFFSYTFNTGLTDQQINDLFSADVKTAFEKARKEWDRYFGNTRKFDSLPRRYHGILTDLVFNIGTLAGKSGWGWPKLAQAILSFDDPEVRVQSLRYYPDDRVFTTV